MNIGRPVATACLLLIGVALAGISETAQSPPSFGNWCGVEVTGENRERHVFGLVMAECSGGCNRWEHSVPFGNWGTSSVFGPAQDSDQYKGWQTTDYPCGGNLNDPEWNSCTTNYPPPGWPYYNEPFGTNAETQLSPGAVTLGTYYDWYSTSEEDGCTILNQSQYSLGGIGFQIYELDPAGDDLQVTHITAAQTFVTLNCDREGCSSVTSGWQTTDSDPVTSAQMRFTARGFLCLDGKGCL